jgi:uncharacterized protein (DUF488 family)
VTGRAILLIMTIFTVGYEGATLEQLLDRLHRTKVQLVVDVRDVPLSRKPGFSKTALSKALELVGLQYFHIRELGCPKPIRDQYRADGNWEAYTRAFMVQLRKQRVAVSQLATMCERVRTALLCYEADPDQCHRAYVARAVSALLGERVMHIGAEGAFRDRATAVGA